MRQEVTRDEMDVVSAVRQGLSERIGPERYGLWFRSGVRLGCEGRSLVVAACDEFLLDRLRRQFARDLEAVGTQLLGGFPSIRFVVDASAGGGAERPVLPHPGPVKRPAGTVAAQSAPEPKPLAGSAAARFARLDAFVVGEGNRVAVTAARSLLRARAASHRFSCTGRPVVARLVCWKRSGRSFVRSRARSAY